MDIGYLLVGVVILLVVIAGIRRFRRSDSVEIDGITYHIDGNGDYSGTKSK